MVGGQGVGWTVEAQRDYGILEEKHQKMMI